MKKERKKRTRKKKKEKREVFKRFPREGPTNQQQKEKKTREEIEMLDCSFVAIFIIIICNLSFFYHGRTAQWKEELGVCSQASMAAMLPGGS
jgi:hypothetical protein